MSSTKKKILDQEDLRKYDIAFRLITGGLRPPVVKALTGLPEGTLRQMWHSLYKSSPPSGLLPTGCGGRITPTKVRDASIFALIYLKIRQSVASSVEDMLDAFSYYQTMQPEGRLDLQDAYYIILDLRIGAISMRKCSSCKAFHLTSLEYMQFRKRCPFCKSKF